MRDLIRKLTRLSSLSLMALSPLAFGDNVTASVFLGADGSAWTIVVGPSSVDTGDYVRTHRNVYGDINFEVWDQHSNRRYGCNVKADTVEKNRAGYLASAVAHGAPILNLVVDVNSNYKECVRWSGGHKPD